MRYLMLLLLTACSAPPVVPDDERLEAQLALAAEVERGADRIDRALLRVELHRERTRRHLWAVTAVDGKLLTYCLDCSVQYWTSTPSRDER